MPELEQVFPSVPVRPVGQDPRRPPPERERRERPRRPAGGLTDDQGVHRDDEPLIDDFA